MRHHAKMALWIVSVGLSAHALWSTQAHAGTGDVNPAPYTASRTVNGCEVREGFGATNNCRSESHNLMVQHQFAERGQFRVRDRAAGSTGTAYVSLYCSMSLQPDVAALYQGPVEDNDNHSCAWGRPFRSVCGSSTTCQEM